MPSRKKRRMPDGELASSGEAGQAPKPSSACGNNGGGNDDGNNAPSTSSYTSSHDLHANLPLFVTGPATVCATSGVAWCHGWRLKGAEAGGAEADASTSSSRLFLDLAVPAGAVARLEAAPLAPGDVPLTARSCRVAVTVPCNGNAGTETASSAAAAVSRAFPQSGTAATTTLPPPPRPPGEPRQPRSPQRRGRAPAPAEAPPRSSSSARKTRASLLSRAYSRTSS